MIELTTVRKHKVSLADYDYKKDIENRLLLSQFTVDEHAVLEEILFSPIKTTARKIAKNVGLQEDIVVPILHKIAKTGLFTFEDDGIVVDKETRKYFETELEKFEDDFQAGMEFLQHLLKKVPIHVLPNWYAIPRTSNNIFDSLIEKYLLTPVIYQRYLLDLTFPNPILSAIAQDVLKSPDYEVPAQELQKKYSLSPEKFHEALLILEFHLVCTLAYRKKGDRWHETVTLFSEWKEHLTFLRETMPKTIADTKKIERYRPTDFAFVDDMATLLSHAKNQQKGPVKFATPVPDDHYLQKLLLKLERVQLAEYHDGKLIVTDAGLEWLDLRTENKALYLYRHPHNQPPGNEKNIREIEKSILRIINLEWVFLSDFLQSLCVPACDGQAIALKKVGRHWKYQRPVYTPDEMKLIQEVVLEHLFEVGIVALGSHQGTACLSVTPFGQSLFG